MSGQDLLPIALDIDLSVSLFFSSAFRERLTNSLRLRSDGSVSVRADKRALFFTH